MKKFFSDKKNIFIVVLILLIGLLVGYHYYKESRRIHFFEFPNTIQVHNGTAYQELDIISKVITNKVLKYDTLYLTIAYMPNIFEYNSNLSAFVQKDRYMPNTYNIFVSRNIKASYYKGILSHEFAHIEQYQSGRLIELSQGIWEYNGDIINALMIPYQHRQFEIDAYEREDEIYRMLENALYR